ncbi:DUF6350 family protein, partial [Actinomadura bangladeshensis]|uniref:cell division protein PerM n=1 Tax=Actinomadura bangladeshensis TaxID=453573 RepID=UPI001EF349EE
ALSLIALAAPFVAGAVGGVLTIRSLPSPVAEGAPLWGFVSGALTGAVAALLSALSGGPLGGGRMATVGPSAWQVGLLAALEVGISAAIAAWVANSMVLRRPARAEAKKTKVKKPKKAKKPKRAVPPRPATVPLSAPVPSDYEPPAKPAPAAPRAPHAPDPVEFEEAEPVLAPRRPRRRSDPLPDLAEERESTEERGRRRPTPPPTGEGTVVVEGHIVDDPEPEPEPEGPRRPVPPPRADPSRTENRGGAIYVLREEPDRDD